MSQEWKGRRVQLNVKMSREAKRMLKALARRAKQPMGEFLEDLIREEYGKR